jgi:hypothetical protein
MCHTTAVEQDHKLIVSHSYKYVSDRPVIVVKALLTHSAGPEDCNPRPMAPMGRAPKFWFGNAVGATMGMSFLRKGAFPFVSSASAISSSCDVLLL